MGVYPLIRPGSFEAASGPVLIDPADAVAMGFARAGAAACFNGAAVLRTVRAGVPCIDHHPGTGARLGVRFEGAIENRLRNSAMAGAAVGVQPTYMSGANSTSNGVTTSVVGTGSEGGITYIDVRWTCTTPVGNGYKDITIDTGANAAAQGQSHSFAVFLRLMSGSFAGISPANLLIYGTPGFNDNASVSFAAITTAALATQRLVVTKTFANSATTGVSPRIAIFATGAVDLTTRIGLPTHEPMPFASSPILTSGAQATRAAATAAAAIVDGSAARAIFFSLRLAAFIGASGAGASRVFQWDDGTESNRVRVQVASDGTLSLRAVVAGVAGTQIAGPVLAINTGYRIGVVFDRASGLLQLWVGTTVYQLSGQALPAGLTRRRWAAHSSGGENMAGWIDGLPGLGGAIAEYLRAPSSDEIEEFMTA